jgi:hypothetical protein
MPYFKRFKQSRGQALVEAALIAPLIIFSFYGYMVCPRYAYMAANFYGCKVCGTDLIA